MKQTLQKQASDIWGKTMETQLSKQNRLFPNHACLRLLATGLSELKPRDASSWYGIFLKICMWDCGVCICHSSQVEIRSLPLLPSLEMWSLIFCCIWQTPAQELLGTLSVLHTLPQEFWDIRHTATMFVFYLVSEDSNVGSHTCGESTLPAEISLCLSTVWSWYLICIRHCCLWAKDDSKDNTYVDRVSGLNPW